MGEYQQANIDVVEAPDPMRRYLEETLRMVAMLRDMSEFDPTLEAEPWPILVEDISSLECLVEALRSLVPAAQCGNDLIGIGEVCDAIERILKSDIVAVNVGLTVGFSRGDTNVKEGIYARLHINSEQIILDELHTTYSSESVHIISHKFMRRLHPEPGSTVLVLWTGYLN